MAERRRLPVLSNDSPPPPSVESADDDRPPWHWAGFGVVAIFSVWVPLSYIGGAISNRLIEGVTPEQLAQAGDAERAKLMLMIALPALVALAIASVGGGFIVGRFGTGPGQRIAAVSGGVTAIIAVLLARTLLTPWVFIISFVIVGAIAIISASQGGRMGANRRPSPPATRDIS